MTGSVTPPQTPWTWYWDGRGELREQMDVGNRLILACGGGGDAVAPLEEDARLIVAARDLLTALEGILALFAPTRDRKPEFESYPEVREARGAIAKARGQS